MRLVDLLWSMADDKSPYRPRIKAGAAEGTLFVTGLRGLKGHRAQTLERCVRNVKERRAVVTSLKVRRYTHSGFVCMWRRYYVYLRQRCVRNVELESSTHVRFEPRESTLRSI